jgi:hypothetical protein
MIRVRSAANGAPQKKICRRYDHTGFEISPPRDFFARSNTFASLIA